MKHSMRLSILIKTIIWISGAIGLVAVYILFSNYEILKPDIPKHSLEKHIQIGGSFNLIDQNGKNFSSNNLKGHISLIYFGFTNSPEDSRSLQKLSDIAKILKDEDITANIVFITLDPERDTSQVLKKYLQQFNSNFIGLTGSSKMIKQVASNFQVFYQMKYTEDNSDYKIEHSPFIYLMNSDGKFLKHYCLNLPSAR